MYLPLFVCYIALLFIHVLQLYCSLQLSIVCLRPRVVPCPYSAAPAAGKQEAWLLLTETQPGTSRRLRRERKASEKQEVALRHNGDGN